MAASPPLREDLLQPLACSRILLQPLNYICEFVEASLQRLGHMGKVRILIQKFFSVVGTFLSVVFRLVGIAVVK